MDKTPEAWAGAWLVLNLLFGLHPAHGLRVRLINLVTRVLFHSVESSFGYHLLRLVIFRLPSSEREDHCGQIVTGTERN